MEDGEGGEAAVVVGEMGSAGDGGAGLLVPGFVVGVRPWAGVEEEGFDGFVEEKGGMRIGGGCRHLLGSATACGGKESVQVGGIGVVAEDGGLAVEGCLRR